MQKNKFEHHDIWVVIPAYNEETTIGQVLEQFQGEPYSILVVDDCSTDGTSEIALKYPITLLRHIINLGQGAALQTGFDYILKQTSAKYIITFDSDGQHQISDLPKLLEPLKAENIDVTLGSRFITNETTKQIPFTKLVTLKLGLLFTKLTTKLKVTDTHNGLRGFTAEALKKIQIHQNRMAHASEILSQIAKQELKYKEVPVAVLYTSYSKKKGQSVFNAFNILWDLFIGKE